jgi:Lar family restriction alleviation protein
MVHYIHNMTPIMPCPFCGNQPKIIEYSYGSLNIVHLNHLYCECGITLKCMTISDTSDESTKRLIELWNKRRTDDE